MESLRRFNLRLRTAVCLSAAEPNLYLLPQAIELHNQVRDQLYDLCVWAPLVVVFRLWRAHCIERSLNHAARAEACRK